MKFGIVVSHPIQHFCPQYTSWAKSRNYELKVFFASALGYKPYYDPNFKKEISWQIDLTGFDHSFLNGEELLPSNKYLDAPRLNHELDSFKPDIIVIYGFFQPLQRRAYAWAKSNGVKLAYISDSELLHQQVYWKRWLKYLFLRRYFRKIDFFLTVGDANEAFYRYFHVPSVKFKRMHFPIDVQQYCNAYENKKKLGNELRIKYQIPLHDFVIGVVGKLVSWKNQDDLIQAIYHLERDQDFVAQILIIGSGDMMEKWKLLAAKLRRSKVYFTGFVGVAELPSYYAALDLYVHPAGLEPHSIAISEAIYMGCPIIISDKCGSYGDSDDVQDGRNGYIFEFGNIPQLARKIKAIFDDRSLREEFGSYSHKIGLSFQNDSHNALQKLIG